jgi:hypothetical protein
MSEHSDNLWHVQCRSCGKWKWSARVHQLTCSLKCRKRISRMRQLIPMLLGIVRPGTYHSKPHRLWQCETLGVCQGGHGA